MKKSIVVLCGLMISSICHSMMTANDSPLAGKTYRYLDKSKSYHISEIYFGSLWSVAIDGKPSGCFYEIEEEMEEGTEVYIYCPGKPKTKYILSDESKLLTPLCQPSLELCQ